MGVKAENEPEKKEKIQKRKSELLEETENSIVKVKKSKIKDNDGIGLNDNEEPSNQDRKKKKSKKKLKESSQETEEKSEPKKTKTKFSLALPLNNENTPFSSEVPTFNRGKGPKIIIAKDDNEKTGLDKNKKSKKSKKGKESESVHESKGMSKALRYLKSWDEDRTNWKFEKCRQIWLLHNAYDNSKVPDSVFPSLLRYISSIKGAMRQQAVDTAKQKTEIPAEIENREPAEELEPEEEIAHQSAESESDIGLRRAKEIIECLQI